MCSWLTFASERFVKLLAFFGQKFDRHKTLQHSCRSCFVERRPVRLFLLTSGLRIRSVRYGRAVPGG